MISGRTLRAEKSGRRPEFFWIFGEFSGVFLIKFRWFWNKNIMSETFRNMCDSKGDDMITLCDITKNRLRRGNLWFVSYLYDSCGLHVTFSYDIVYYLIIYYRSSSGRTPEDMHTPTLRSCDYFQSRRTPEDMRKPTPEPLWLFSVAEDVGGRRRTCVNQPPSPCDRFQSRRTSEDAGGHA